MSLWIWKRSKGAQRRSVYSICGLWLCVAVAVPTLVTILLLVGQLLQRLAAHP